MGVRLAKFAPYTAVEPDHNSREIAARRLAPASELVADLSELADRQYGLLCAFEVLEHIPNDEDALREWVDHVRPGGWMLFSVPGHRSRFSDADVIAGHIRRYDPGDFQALLERVGLATVTVESYGFPLGHVLEASRNHLARRSGLAGRSIEERTSASARFHQPTARTALMTRVGTAPFRRLQRLFSASGRGVGLLGMGQVPQR